MVWFVVLACGVQLSMSRGYDVVILDEAHERSLHTDVLFALMKRTLAQRQAQKRTFKILVTSATLDTGQFSAYFNNCPVLDIPGRTFKVDLHYHPISKTQRVVAAVNVALNLHVREGPGHILVFLTGLHVWSLRFPFFSALRQMQVVPARFRQCVETCGRSSLLSTWLVAGDMSLLCDRWMMGVSVDVGMGMEYRYDECMCQCICECRRWCRCMRNCQCTCNSKFSCMSMGMGVFVLRNYHTSWATVASQL